MLDFGVVMARQWQASGVACCNNSRAIGYGVAFLMRSALHNQCIVFSIFKTAVALGITPVLVQVAPLTLTRRMVHYADKFKQWVIGVRFKHLDNIGR